MRYLQTTFPILFAFICHPLFADQVAFKNGDRLSGAILKSDAKNLLMKTAVAGEVTVSWQEIKELHSDLPLHVELVDGGSLVGKMTTREGQLRIVTNAGIALEAKKDSVVALRNDAEQAAYEKSQHRSLLQGWNGALDTGAELTRGNAETRNFRLAFRALRQGLSSRLSLFAESIYSLDDVPDARPHVTASQERGGALFEQHFVSNFFVFGNTDFMSDDLQDLNLRSVVGGGLGYHLIKRDRAKLDVLGGANFTRENYVEVQRNLMAGQLGEEFNFKVGKNTSLIQTIAFFPDLTAEVGDYRTNFNFRSVTKIVKWFGWQNNLSDTYVTNPPAGKKKNEFVFTSGVQLAFSH